MDKQHERHQEKYGWVENKAKEASLMLIEASKKDEDGKYLVCPCKRHWYNPFCLLGNFPAVQTWNYTVRNQLMYVPDGALMPPPPPKGPPKEIASQNTRINANPSLSSAALASADPAKRTDRDAVWSMMAANDRQILEMRKAERESGRVDLADLLGTPKGIAASPKVGGYGFVATPSPAPGVDMSPMTTWGRLDGTPLLLDPTDTPLDLTPGPNFKVPDTPRREELAMKLADKANQAQKARKAARTPIHAGASPYGRGPALSPAGRSLLASKTGQRKSVGADMQLRASYNSPAVNNARGKGGVTPSPLTPSPSPLIGKAPTPSRTSSLTDNLLDIPSGKSAKGKSITDNLLNI